MASTSPTATWNGGSPWHPMEGSMGLFFGCCPDQTSCGLITSEIMLGRFREAYQPQALPYHGAPRPMKMGTIASRWRYDVEALCALQSASLRHAAILHSASRASRYRRGSS